MRKRVKVSPEEFEAIMQGRIRSFMVYWRNHVGESPDDFPAALEGPSQDAAVAEWIEQYEAWWDSECERVMAQRLTQTRETATR